MYVRRLKDFNANTATPMLANLLSEPYEKGLLPMPRRVGLVPYLEARVALTRCRWLGTARGWVDPVAERQGAVLGLDAGFSTLEEEAAQQGMDFEENIEQRAYEIDLFRQHNIPLPEWGGVDKSATEVARKPEAA